MSANNGDAVVKRYADRFRAAVAAGQLRDLKAVWSPADTVADTRYQYEDVGGTSHIVLQNEVNGFLTGLERERQTARNSR